MLGPFRWRTEFLDQTGTCKKGMQPNLELLGVVTYVTVLDLEVEVVCEGERLSVAGLIFDVNFMALVVILHREGVVHRRINISTLDDLAMLDHRGHQWCPCIRPSLRKGLLHLVGIHPAPVETATFLVRSGLAPAASVAALGDVPNGNDKKNGEKKKRRDSWKFDQHKHREEEHKETNITRSFSTYRHVGPDQHFFAQFINAASLSSEMKIWSVPSQMRRSAAGCRS